MTDTTTETNSEQARNSRRVLEGIVSSDAMDKSITIRVERKFKHPKYKKYIVVERPSLPAGAVKPVQVQAAATADAMGGESDGSEEVKS
jgi:hypothetical protein